MQLTRFSDYALRVLMFAQAADGRLVTIEEMAGAYGISRAHLMKVVNALTRAGYLTAVRGRSGGVKLARPAADIVLGDVVRATEPDFALVECFASGNQCVITRRCKLQGVLGTALKAFLDALDQHTLESISLRRRISRACGRADASSMAGASMPLCSPRAMQFPRLNHNSTTSAPLPGGGSSRGRESWCSVDPIPRA